MRAKNKINSCCTLTMSFKRHYIRYDEIDDKNRRRGLVRACTQFSDFKDIEEGFSVCNYTVGYDWTQPEGAGTSDLFFYELI